MTLITRSAHNILISSIQYLFGSEILITNHTTNNHLKKVMKDVSNFLNSGSEIPPDLLEDLQNELKVSNLIIPATIRGEFMSFNHMTLDDGHELLGVFTDIDEFLKFTDEFDPISNDFDFYLDLIHSHHLTGMVINPKSDDFFMDMTVLSKIHPFTQPEYDGEAYSPERLKEIADNLSNDSLVEFIRLKDNLRNYEGLESQLEKTHLLNAVSQQEDLDGFAQNGIINGEDVGGFALSILHNASERFLALFTSKEAISTTCDNDEISSYCQVCDLSRVFEFVLCNDMEGAIINPGIDDYFIPRSALICMLKNENLINPKLMLAVDYAFIV